MCQRSLCTEHTMTFQDQIFSCLLGAGETNLGAENTETRQLMGGGGLLL